MKKSLFKKYLQLLDKCENDPMDFSTTYSSFLSHFHDEEDVPSFEEFTDFCRLLQDTHNLIIQPHFFELSQPLYLFARSAHHSALEALSLFEAFLQHKELYSYFEHHLDDALHFDLLPFFDIAKETLLFQNHSLHKQWHAEYRWIMEDVALGYNCSTCLKSYYTSTLYAHTSLPMRNQNHPIAPYSHIKEMQSIFPVLGIPLDRECSRDLQVFFKDCLFHEFDHQCCICKANLPQMLIASHIKPFRDCGYLIEAMDANNGLLLCRNHDFLFDQGYFSFDENGKILISDEIKHPSTYQLRNDFILEKRHLTIDRNHFLDYHCHHIFRR